MVGKDNIFRENKFPGIGEAPSMSTTYYELFTNLRSTKEFVYVRNS
jgi:hypothetical protein